MNKKWKWFGSESGRILKNLSNWFDHKSDYFLLLMVLVQEQKQTPKENLNSEKRDVKSAKLRTWT